MGEKRNWMDLVRGKQEGEKKVLFSDGETEIWYVPKVLNYAEYNAMVFAMQGGDEDKISSFLGNIDNQKSIIKAGIARHNINKEADTKKGFTDEDFLILAEMFPQEVMNIASEIMRISAPLAQETETS